MPPRLTGFSFAAVERSLCPATYKQIDSYAQRKAAEEAGEGGGGEEATTPKRHRARPPSSRDLPTAGLLSLPDELLEQICAETKSLSTLFHLSLTCRRLFRLLRRANSSSVRSLWKRAFWSSRKGKERKVGTEKIDKVMKRCGMGFVEYADLVYGRFCHVCTLANVDKIILFHSLRLRCCTKCAEKYVLSEERISFDHPFLHTKAFACSRSIRCKLSTLEFGDVVEVQPRNQLAVRATSSTPSRSRHPLDPLYFLPEVLAQSAVLQAIDAADQTRDRRFRKEYVKWWEERKDKEEDLLLEVWKCASEAMMQEVEEAELEGQRNEKGKGKEK